MSIKQVTWQLPSGAPLLPCTESHRAGQETVLISEKGFQCGLCISDYYTCWEQVCNSWRLAPGTPQICVFVHLDGNKGGNGVSVCFVGAHPPFPHSSCPRFSSLHILPHILYTIGTIMLGVF